MTPSNLLSKSVKEGSITYKRLRERLISFRHPQSNIEKLVIKYAKDIETKCGFNPIGNLSGDIDSTICVLIDVLTEKKV